MGNVPGEVEAALREGRWDDALARLGADANVERTPELLELRAQAHYGRGELEASIEAWEVQHRLLIETGDHEGAARAAAMVAMFLMIDTGLMAPVRAWLRRAGISLRMIPTVRCEHSWLRFVPTSGS